MTQPIYDVAIVGAGPTGLSAALYTTREDLKTIVLDKGVAGGLIATTEWVDNYPGFPKGIGGIELAEQFKQQAERFGAEIKLFTEVKGVQLGDQIKIDSSAGEISARTLLIATGSSYRHLGVPGEKELEGRGIHYCATCDGPLYRDKELIVAGGGNTAMQETLFLAKFAKKITMLVRGTEFKGSEILIDAIQAKSNVHAQFETEVSEVVAKDGKFANVRISSKGGDKEISADGMFVFIGLIPNTEWLPGEVALDERKLVVANRKFETSVPGVFAAGDVVEGSIGQVASAVGEGVSAALSIRAYLDSHHS